MIIANVIVWELKQVKELVKVFLLCWQVLFSRFDYPGFQKIGLTVIAVPFKTVLYNYNISLSCSIEIHIDKLYYIAVVL